MGLKSGEQGLIGPGSNNYGRDDKLSFHSHKPGNQAVSLMLQAAKELERAAAEITRLRLMVRELAMRTQRILPTSEQDEKWFNEGTDAKLCGDFMRTLFDEIAAQDCIK